MATTTKEVVRFLFTINLERKNPHYQRAAGGVLRAAPSGACVYVNPELAGTTEPSCIAGRVFGKFAGDLLEGLRGDDTSTVGDVQGKAGWGERFTDDAWAFLGEIQRRADGDQTWADAVNGTLHDGY